MTDAPDAAPFVPRLIDELLDRAAREHPTRIAVVAGSERFDYATLAARVDRLAAALQARGVAAGDRVAILDKNSVAYLELYYALPRIGAVAVPLNYRLALREHHFLVEDAGARVLVFGPGYEATARELALPLSIATPAADAAAGPPGALPWSALLADAAAHPTPVARDSGDVFLQMYTSGTTGRPKGAMLTHANLIANTMTAMHERDYTPADNYLHVCPLYHCADLELYYGLTYACGGHVVLAEFHPAEVLATIVRERVSVVFLVPAMINFLLEHLQPDHELGSLRLIVYGGAAIPEDRLRRALERLPCQLSQGYGLTETSPLLCILPAADHVLDGPRARRIASCGRPVWGVEVRVVEDDGSDCAPGVVGEIVARGANIMKGYWKQPEETARALRGGWFHTGDLARRDEDGYLYIVDRKKDMIVSGGENVYPREVEEVLYTHPAVLEAAVIGVPSERWGETVKAVVVLRPGHDPGAAGVVDGAALIAYCRERLAHYKCPTSVDLVAALPRNPSGKVLKRELREPYWTGQTRRVN